MAETSSERAETAQTAATPPARPLLMSDAIRDELSRRSTAGYPHEVCGLVVGRADAGSVERITQATNLRGDRLTDRYVPDPDDFLKADAHAQRDGLEIVGVWHTHPDHPRSPPGPTWTRPGRAIPS